MRAMALAQPAGSTVSPLSAGVEADYVALPAVAVMAAMLTPAARVIAVDVSAARLELASELGATDTVNPADGDPVSALLEIDRRPRRTVRGRDQRPAGRSRSSDLLAGFRRNMRRRRRSAAGISDPRRRAEPARPGHSPGRHQPGRQQPSTVHSAAHRIAPARPSALRQTHSFLRFRSDQRGSTRRSGSTNHQARDDAALVMTTRSHARSIR